jgi:hypothetical protein
MRTAIDCAREIAALKGMHAEIARLRSALGGRVAHVVPEISAWSIERHLYHAALSADLAFANVVALLEGKSPRIVMQGAPNELALRVFAAGGYPRGESQAPRAVWPPERPDPELLESELARNRESVGALEGRAEGIARAEGLIPHRQLGELSAAEWLRFARLHTEHHLAIAQEIGGRVTGERRPPEGGTTNPEVTGGRGRR